VPRWGGIGPPLVMVQPELSSRGSDWESPAGVRLKARRRPRSSRYDERGCGLSDTEIGDPPVDVCSAISKRSSMCGWPDASRCSASPRESAIAGRVRGTTPGPRRDLVLYAGMRATLFLRRGEEEAGRRRTRSACRLDGAHPQRSAGCSMLVPPNGPLMPMSWARDLRGLHDSRGRDELYRARGGVTSVSSRRGTVRAPWSCTRGTIGGPWSRKGRLLAALIPDAHLVLPSPRITSCFEHEPCVGLFRS